MSTSGRNEDWTGPQLAARLATLGVAPEPVAYLVCRSSISPDGKETLRFQAMGEPAPFPQQDLPAWLARHQLRGAERLALALLVIREVLDEQGLIRQCSLERRRGALDGPLDGNPARVEFTGPARMIRFYRAQRDGKLVEIAADTEMLPASHHAPEQMAGELAALRAHFGPGLRVLDVRTPTALEALVGCNSILHVQLPGGREIGCGIGWHGPVPFVLPAEFPRFGAPLALPPEDEAAVQKLIQRDGLMRHETRLDGDGLAVIARRRGSAHLLLLRPGNGTVAAEPYEPEPSAAASDDQTSWMRYAETYEHLAILDSWLDDGTGGLLVISGEASGQIWRHHLDSDGVETWRKPDDEAAAGLLYRERLTPGMLAATDVTPVEAPLPSPPVPVERHTAPPDSLLAKAEAYVTAVAALHDAQDAADAEPGSAEALAHLRALQPALETLGAEYAAAEAGRLLQRIEADGGVSPDSLAAALAHIAARLPEELAATRLLTLTPAQWRRLAAPSPFGHAVEDAFPEAVYDGEEAAFCLAFRRPTAAVFHCLRVIEAGLAALGERLGLALPGEERRWTRIMAQLRRVGSADHAAVLQRLEKVRRCWHGAHLAPVAKCTEAEAEQLFQAVGAFMTELAALIGESPQA